MTEWHKEGPSCPYSRSFREDYPSRKPTPLSRKLSADRSKHTFRFPGTLDTVES